MQYGGWIVCKGELGLELGFRVRVSIVVTVRIRVRFNVTWRVDHLLR
jgi:hypothetical protein